MEDVAEHLGLHWNTIKEIHVLALTRKLKRIQAQIKAIAMDMWPAYISATMKYYPSNVKDRKLLRTNIKLSTVFIGY